MFLRAGFSKTRALLFRACLHYSSVSPPQIYKASFFFETSARCVVAHLLGLDPFLQPLVSKCITQKIFTPAMRVH